jgi:hypothetical protein
MMLLRSIPCLALAASLVACANGQPDQTAASAAASVAPSVAASVAPSVQPSASGSPIAVATPVGSPDPTPGATAQPTPFHPPLPKDFEGRGIYMTASSMMLPRYQTLMKGLVASKGNMFVFDGKDEGGIVSWKSKVPLAVQVKADKEGLITDLHAKVEEAHKLGVKVAGRIVCFNDPILAKARPDLCVRRADGFPGELPGFDRHQVRVRGPVPGRVA